MTTTPTPLWQPDEKRLNEGQPAAFRAADEGLDEHPVDVLHQHLDCHHVLDPARHDDVGVCLGRHDKGLGRGLDKLLVLLEDAP